MSPVEQTVGQRWGSLGPGCRDPVTSGLMCVKRQTEPRLAKHDRRMPFSPHPSFSAASAAPHRGGFVQTGLPPPDSLRAVPRPMRAAPSPSCYRAQDADAAFIALLGAYRARGGMARQRCHLDAADSPQSPAATTLGSLIDEGAVFAFRWHDALWIPLFQLASGGGAAAAPQRAVAELGIEFDAWALAHWFVRPNSCLNDDLPVDCLRTRLPEVLQAAREDRFVAIG